MVFVAYTEQTGNGSKAAYIKVQTVPSHDAQQAEVNTQAGLSPPPTNENTPHRAKLELNAPIERDEDTYPLRLHNLRLHRVTERLRRLKIDAISLNFFTRLEWWRTKLIVTMPPPRCAPLFPLNILIWIISTTRFQIVPLATSHQTTECGLQRYFCRSHLARYETATRRKETGAAICVALSNAIDENRDKMRKVVKGQIKR